MASPEKYVYIIVLNYEDSANTIECLKSFEYLKYRNYKVIVCDNASTDNSLSNITTWLNSSKIDFTNISAIDGRQSKDIKYFICCSSHNGGYAAGNNIGLRFAMSQLDFAYAWILNNDTVVDPNSLTALIGRVERGKKIGICGSQLRYFSLKQKIQLQGGGTYNKYLGTVAHIGSDRPVNSPLLAEAVERQLDYVSGASMLVTKDFITKVGLMDERYFLFYEELDWSLRARGLFLLGYADDSIVYHKVGESYKANNRSTMADYYGIRSRILLTKKFYPLLLLVVCPLILFGTASRRLLSGRLKQAWQAVCLALTLGAAN